MAILSQEFYQKSTLAAAPALLGKYLVRQLDGEILAGRILETEAYLGQGDRACHARGGVPTARTAVMFGPPGRAYIYMIYGMYHCLNLVTEPEGQAAAVLIRALEPAAGLEGLCRRRYGENPLTPARRRGLLNGPGKDCQALGLTRAETGVSLEGPSLFVCDSLRDAGLPEQPRPEKERLCRGPRIGIDYAGEARDFPWRFWLEKEEQ